MGLLAMWIGHALAMRTWNKQLPLDYYLYSSFTEKPGNQCYVHDEDSCRACLDHCVGKPLPKTAFWLPKWALYYGHDKWAVPYYGPCPAAGNYYADCGKKGLADVVGEYLDKPASQLWIDLEARLSKIYGNVDTSVFDVLLSSRDT